MPEHITKAALWVQFFHIPVNALNQEGLLIIGKEVGTVLSQPLDGYVGGKKFIKIKILVDLS